MKHIKLFEDFLPEKNIVSKVGHKLAKMFKDGQDYDLEKWEPSKGVTDAMEKLDKQTQEVREAMKPYVPEDLLEKAVAAVIDKYGPSRMWDKKSLIPFFSVSDLMFSWEYDEKDKVLTVYGGKKANPDFKKANYR